MAGHLWGTACADPNGSDSNTTGVALKNLVRIATQSTGLATCVLLVACATTTVTLHPSPQAPVCNASSAALVLWASHWRPDQKDVSAREEAAAAGLKGFLAGSRCFARAQLRRVKELAPATVRDALDSEREVVPRVVGVEVRELGPVVKLLSSAALIEGGTEVVLRIVEYSPRSAAEVRQFVVHWTNGGPGVVQGVAGLAADMQSALEAGLQPGAGAKRRRTPASPGYDAQALPR